MCIATKTNLGESSLLYQSPDATKKIISKERRHLGRGVQHLCMLIWESEGLNNMRTSINLQERKISNSWCRNSYHHLHRRRVLLFYNVHCGFAGDLAMNKKSFSPMNCILCSCLLLHLLKDNQYLILFALTTSTAGDFYVYLLAKKCHFSFLKRSNKHINLRAKSFELLL